jgi:hypothetical protein
MRSIMAFYIIFIHLLLMYSDRYIFTMIIIL